LFCFPIQVGIFYIISAIFKNTGREKNVNNSSNLQEGFLKRDEKKDKIKQKREEREAANKLQVDIFKRQGFKELTIRSK